MSSFMLKVSIYLIAVIYFINGVPEDYRSIIDRLKLVYYNKKYVSADPHFKVFRYNKTSWALNVSFNLLYDIDGRDIESTTRAFVYLSNTYRFTGFEIKVNACKMWEDDLYGIRTLMSKYGNIEICDIRKGNKYISNFWPESKYYPKSIPQGSFKVEMNSYLLNGTKLVQLNWYGRASLYFKEMGNSSPFQDGK